MSEEPQNSDLSVTDIENGRDSPPQIPLDSPGSSASSRLKDEYSQLLKYTVESTPGLNTILSGLQDTENGSLNYGAEIEGDRNENNTSQESGDEETCRKSTINMKACAVAMGGKLDGWLDTLKENILGELKGSLMSSLRSQHEDHKKSVKGLQAEKVALQKEVNRLNEQMNGLEHSFQQKCTLIKNLTDSLVAQKKKVDMAKHFYHWKADHYDKQREIFTEKLAAQHHERKLNLRVLKAWYGVIQTRWRSRTERKSQTQAKEMCLNLTSDYETKVCMLNEKISALEKKVSLLQAEREMYSEQVRKAFMRGMCALNMETMSVFGEDQQKQTLVEESPIDLQEVSTFDTNTLATSMEDVHSKSYQGTEENFMSNNSHHSHTSCSPTRTGGSKQPEVIQRPVSLAATCSSKTKVTKSRPKSAKAQGNSNKFVPASQVLAPPMASVIVERHPPVNKQTMGKATAVRYPKKNAESASIHMTTVSCGKNKGIGEMRFKPLAGQRDNLNDNKISDRYIKVVE